ncbi:serine/threonine-protein kinase [Pseudokineococcus sp. 1T1Z-3]|uniref:serine/threonine-protein kinase n=1 Tax=Pseudokineococcus sp. 1T1Z-3 TaxID=3132745 RepID=UPI003099E0AE
MAGRHAAGRGGADGEGASWWEELDGLGAAPGAWPLGQLDPGGDPGGEPAGGPGVQGPAGRAVPPVVPGYVVERLLGAGGSGEVWRGRPVGTAPGETAPVALKVLRSCVAGDPVAQHRLEAEASLLAALGDEHVVRLEGVVSSAPPDPRTVLVLEHAPGGSLGALVARRGALDAGEVVTVLVPLAGVLERLHAGGVVHGDVAPGNVLFAADGRPLLGDLGTAVLLACGQAGADASPPGHLPPGEEDVTTGYADPERVAGGAPSAAGDVYALGACAWHALAGMAPGAPQVRPPLVTLRPELPRALVDLVEDCLEPDPRERPLAADLARRAWDAAEAEAVRLVGTDPHAPPDEVITHRVRAAARRSPAPVEERPRRRGLRPRAGRAVAGAAGLALLLALGGLVAPSFWPRPSAAVDEEAAGPAGSVAPEPSEPSEPSETAERAEPSETAEQAEPAEEADARSGGPDAPAATSRAPSPRPPVEASEARASEVGALEVRAGEVDALDAQDALTLRGQDPLAAVPVLARLRAQALATRDPELLARVVAPGSAAMAADEEALAQLQRSGRLEGLDVEVLRVSLVAGQTPGADGSAAPAAGEPLSALVDVRTRTPAHRLVGDDGAVLAEVPGADPVDARLRLVDDGEGWRVAEVLAPP